MVWDEGLWKDPHSVPSFAKLHGTPGGQEDTGVLSGEYSACDHTVRQDQARTQTPNVHNGLSQQQVRFCWQLLLGRDYP